ncbi:zinc-binding alcohol dehydrogenase family protein [Bradyrhizobium sp. dw_78]|uniref:zinc-binding alcohol dehydrogenase family protein n=1 Tax=Bradyrhizobium sp. dw_78 TaxID=2719793 RepID=UPI001BD52F0D|nr:zinc-binding alcohol dehydrogenase family protein [Bradyrhizobium sp. dw_78]
MRAVGLFEPSPLSAEQTLADLEIPAPEPGPRDLKVAVRAVSINPADYFMRRQFTPTPGKPRVLGYDASGVVEAVGSDISLFKPGDEVFYAGDMTRAGSNAELQLVDERIVGPKPKTLSFLEAAAMPLTSITAWELLFDRLGVGYGSESTPGVLLIINGAGGVGSMLTQLARQLTGLTVVATASRPETIAWCEEMGAHHVINHHEPLDEGLRRIGIEQADFIAGLTGSDRQMSAIVKVIAPQGRFALIDNPDVLDIAPFKLKCVSVHWEMMFTRSMFHTPDMIQQHRLLTSVAELVDVGVLRTTLMTKLGPMSAATIAHGHSLAESGRSIGKIVLSGFPVTQ